MRIGLSLWRIWNGSQQIVRRANVSHTRHRGLPRLETGSINSCSYGSGERLQGQTRARHAIRALGGLEMKTWRRALLYASGTVLFASAGCSAASSNDASFGGFSPGGSAAVDASVNGNGSL